MQYLIIILLDKQTAKLLPEKIYSLQAHNSQRIMLLTADLHLNLCKHYAQWVRHHWASLHNLL